MSAGAAAVEIGDVTVGGGAPLAIIAGPCAAESEKLCLEVADAIAEVCAKAGLGFVFKASFDKANRSKAAGRRGPGMDEGLAILDAVRSRCKVPVITDIHLPDQAAQVATVADALQIPAFLCRQTDLAAAAAETGKPVNLKKGQFVAPDDMPRLAEKCGPKVMVCERGSSFGYHNLVVDMRSLVQLRACNCPVVFDATHSTQLPGAAIGESGGDREFAAPLARAAAAVGIDALFIETHTDPAAAISDAAVQLPLAAAAEVIETAAIISELVRSEVSQ